MDQPTETPKPLTQTDSYSSFNSFLKFIFFFILGTAITMSSIAAGVLLYAHTHGGPSSLTPFEKLWNPELRKQSSLVNTTINTQPIKNPLKASEYRNTVFNLAFTIPPEYTAKESSYGLGVTNIELRKQSNLSEATAPDIQILIFPKAMARLIGQDFDAYRAMQENTVKQINDAQGSQMFTKLSNRTINTLRAFDYKTISATPSTNEEAEAGTYVEAGGSIFIISTRESTKTILEPILTSLKHPL